MITKFKIPKKEHNRLLPLRKVDWRETVEYEIKESGLFYNKYPSILCKLFSIFLIIPSILMEGIPRTYNALKELFFSKKYGSYVSELISWKNNEDYEERLNEFLKHRK